MIDSTIDSAADELLWTTYYLTYRPVRDRIDANGATSKRGAVDPRTTDSYNDTATLIANGEQVLVTNFLGAHHWKTVIADADAADGQVLSHPTTSRPARSTTTTRTASASSRRRPPRPRAPSPTPSGTIRRTPAWSVVSTRGELQPEFEEPPPVNDAFDNDYDGLTDAPIRTAPRSSPAARLVQGFRRRCSSGTECCSGTCLHGRTRTCS